MDGVSTMNLNDSGSDGMTPLFLQKAPPQPQQQKAPEASTEQKQKGPPTGLLQPEKNISKQKGMDSTPIGDVISAGGDGELIGSPLGGVDPRFVMAQQPMYMQQPQMMVQPQQQQFVKNKNPMNLTDEQVEALFAGVAAIIAFSNPVQTKLSSFIPQFLAESGERSNIGILISALVVAAIFYFGRRFVIPN